MKKNENGISLIIVVLTILIVIASVGIYFMFTNESTIDVGNYYEENIVGAENEAERYYYKQLKEPAKLMYNTILQHENALKNGDETIKFPSTVSDSIKKLENDEENYFQSAWDAIALDKLDLFYVNTNNLSLETKKWSLLSFKTYDFTLKPYEGKRYYTDTFNSWNEVDSAKNQVDQIVDNILSGANGTTYDKVKYVHDWIVDNFDYDTENRKDKDNIYGAFINKTVVCEGYAEAFKYMLDKLNIPCVLVYGEGIDNEGKTETHAWNYVKMPDEKWYAVDTTWDDPIYIGISNWFRDNSHRYANFLKGSKEFNVSHISNGDVSGTGQDFKYPELSETDYKIGR